MNARRGTAARTGRGLRVWGSLVVAALLGSLAVAVAPPASADENSLWFAGREDVGSITLGANDVLRIDGRLSFSRSCYAGGFNDFAYPVSDVYLVPSYVNLTDPDRSSGQWEFATLVDGSGVGTPNTIVQTGSFFSDEVIGVTAPTGSLGEGDYQVVFDTCQDGKFQPSQDTIFPTAVHVRMPTVIPPIDESLKRLKSASFAESDSWQQAAAMIDKILDSTKIVKQATCVTGKIAQCWDAIKMWVDSPEVQKFAEYADATKEAADCLKDTRKCLSVLERWTGISVPSVPGAWDYLKAPLGATKQLALAQANHFYGIYADPPRADFTTPSTPVVGVPAPPLATGNQLLDGIGRLTSPLEREAALTQAFLDAVERYQGAQRAGDVESARAQLRSAISIGQTLVDAMPATTTALSGIPASMLAAAPNADTISNASRTTAAGWIKNGLSSSDAKALRNLGLDTAGRSAWISEATSLWADSYDLPSRNAQDVVDLIVPRRAATTAGLQDTLASLRAVEASFPAVTVPTVSTDGPWTASLGVPVTLGATATGATSLSWDLDADGVFGDATGATVSQAFWMPGQRVVSVRADGPGGTVTAQGLISITSTDALPSVTQSPATRPVTVGSGAVRTLSVSATDPEGEPLGYVWSVDGDTVPGTTSSYDFTSTDLGVHRVQVVVSDDQPGHHVPVTWLVQVTAPDADADGWADLPAADCDATDGDRNPGRTEILFNGKDDDCNDATPDQPLNLGTGGALTMWGTNAGITRPASTDDYVRVVQMPNPYVNMARFALRSNGAVMTTASAGAAPTAMVGIGNTGTLTGVSSISSKGSPTGALLPANGEVVTWGSIDAGIGTADGALGSGGATSRYYPDYVLKADGTRLTGITKMWMAGQQGFAVDGSGQVWQWGRRSCTGVQSYFARTWYATPSTTLPTDIVEWDMVANGIDIGVMRRADGSVMTCGDTQVLGTARSDYNWHALAGFGPSNPAVQVTASSAGIFILDGKGDVWVKATDSGVAAKLGVPTLTLTKLPLPAGAPVAGITIDSDQGTIRRTDGSLLAFGTNTFVSQGTTASPCVLNSWCAAHVVAVDGYVFDSIIQTWDGAAIAVPSARVSAAGWTAPQPQITANAVGDTGDEGTTLHPGVSLSAPAPADLAVAWRFGDRTGTVVVPKGQTSATVEVSVARDFVWGTGDRTFGLDIVSAALGATVARARADVVVRDIDPRPTATASDVVVDEGDAGSTGAEATVTLSAAAAAPVTVHVSSRDDSAVVGTDYSPVDLDVVVPAGQTSATVPVVVLGNLVPQPDRRLLLDVVAGGQATASASTVTIRDDDPVRLVLGDASVAAGEDAKVDVSAVGLPDGESVTLGWATRDATAAAGADYVAGSGTVTLAGSAHETITVATLLGAGASLAAGDPRTIQMQVVVTPAQNGRRVLPSRPAAVRILTSTPDTGDTVPPVVTGTPDRAPNAAGWYRAPVTISWTAVDAVDGTLPSPADTVVSAESDGTGPDLVSEAACDSSGNCATGSYGDLKLDTHAPTVTIAGLVDGGSYTAGAVPSATCGATDALSGVAGSCSVGSTSSTPGAYSLTATASDAAGNTGTRTVRYSVVPAVTAVTYSGTTSVVSGGTVSLSATGVPAQCTSPLAYSLDTNPLTGAPGTYALSAPSVSTTGWLLGAYVVTVAYPTDALCTGSTDSTSAIAVGAASSGSAIGGGYYNAPGGRSNLGFEVHAVPRTATSAAGVKGQLLWTQKGVWRFKGTLGSLSVTNGLATSSGSGRLSYWVKTSTGGNWVDATTGTTTVTIQFTATTPSTKKSTGTPGTFAIGFAGTRASGVPALPTIEAPRPLAGGTIRIW